MTVAGVVAGVVAVAVVAVAAVALQERCLVRHH